MEDKYNIKPLDINDLTLIKDLFFDVFTNAPWNDDWSNKEHLNKYFIDIIDNKNSLSLGLFKDTELSGISLGSIIHWCSGTEYSRILYKKNKSTSRNWDNFSKTDQRSFAKKSN